MNSFSILLKDKYGDEIYNSLVEGKESLRLKKGYKDEVYKNQLENKVINKFDISPNIKNWAFDFPGWIGDLNNKTKRRNKEIMVIGLEPHISDHSFQVTYGLRETMKNEFDEIGFGNNQRLWNNLFDLFNSNSKELDKKFLSRFYITDLCHFAPRGNANLIKQIPTWKKIREKIALNFLPKEIDLLQPKYIVSHGLVACHIIDNKILKKKGIPLNWKSPKELNEKFNTRLKNLPFLSQYEINGKLLYHVGLPHLASGQTHNFWKDKKRVKYIKNQLHELENQN